jgi:hypothetical protein
MTDARHGNVCTTVNRPNLILGVVAKYDLPPLLPFLNSLARTGFRGETHLFCARMKEETLDSLRSRGVHVHPFRFRSEGICNSWARFWPWLRPLRSQLLLREVADLFVLRFILYREFLKAHGRRHANVLLTDVRDVAFQCDPFSESHAAGVDVFAEDARRTNGSCPLNSRWLRDGYGAGALARVGAKPILCAGTLMGTTRELDAFLRALLHLIARGRQTACVEQSAMNLLVHTRNPPCTRVWANGSGPVFNLRGLADGDLTMNARGEFVRPDGSAHPILHEYDRVASVRKRIETMFGGPAATGSPVKTPCRLP